ncbi:MAG: hypothetical protein RSG93_06780 [Acinetobacter sp.]
MENPEKIEIEGLKTIHKLCRFGADHNMEGCSFTEIVERMFDELAKAQAVPEGFVLVPMVPSERMINAVRQCYEGEAYLPYSLYSEFVNQAIIERMEAQEPAND